MANLRIEFDRKANAAYIYLVDTIEQGASVKQVVCCRDEKHVAGEVILDFNKNGKLLGIDYYERDSAALAGATATGDADWLVSG